MLTNISKWGNSLGIRIPRSIAAELGISEGAPVELTVEDDHLLIQKVITMRGFRTNQSELRLGAKNRKICPREV